MTSWFLSALLGYLLGAVPFGLVLTRLAGGGDLRAIGSGNIGATNVLRTGRKGLAALTLLLDMAKGAGAVLVAAALWGAMAGVVAGAAALVGHCFPVWLRFRGGKGVATMLGVSFAIDWRIGLASALMWAAVAVGTRISSAGGMGSAVAAPVAALALGSRAWPVLAAMAMVVVVQHRANIARLLAGTEPKIGAGK